MYTLCHAYSFNLFENLFKSENAPEANWCCQSQLESNCWITNFNFIAISMNVLKCLWWTRSHFEVVYVCAVEPLYCSRCYLILFSLLTYKFYYLCSFSPNSVKKAININRNKFYGTVDSVDSAATISFLVSSSFIISKNDSVYP